jgi:hypothetical protein
LAESGLFLKYNMPRNANCICSTCEKPIYRRPSQIVGNVFCSNECCGKFQRLNEKICLICGNSFIGHKKNCSRACSNKARTGIKYDGANSNNKATKSKRLKLKIASKRSGKCEECGNENYNILQIHHIIEKCNGGGDEESNLKLLCPNCHYTKHLGYSNYKEVEPC